MLIPYNTDAPVYHWPAVTVGLIVLNVLVYVLGTISMAEEYVNKSPFENFEDVEEFEGADPEDVKKFQELLKEHGNNPQEEAPQPGALPKPGAAPAEKAPHGEDEEEEMEAPEPAAATLFAPSYGWHSNLTPEQFRKGMFTFTRNFALVYGDGLKPWQWFTALFVHESIWLLVADVLFLWSFGLVVEGKLGWWRFLLIYLAIGMGHNAVEQTFSFLYPLGYSSGPSAAIFGLMAMCLIWAPMNDLSVVMWIAYRAIQFEVAIWKFSLFYVATSLLEALLSPFAASHLLHVLGALSGTGIGLLFLKMNWVDCEGWDVFKVMKNEHGRSDLISRRPDKSKMTWGDDDAPAAKSGDKLQKLHSKLKRLIKAGDLSVVIPEYEKFKELQGELDEPETLKLIELFLADKEVDEAIPLMVEYLERFEAQEAVMRVKLARLYLGKNRPKAAVKVLKPLKPDDLPDALQERRQAIFKKAKELIDQGTIELSE